MYGTRWVTSEACTKTDEPTIVPTTSAVAWGRRIDRCAARPRSQGHASIRAQEIVMRIDRRAFLGSSAAAAVGATACNQAPPAPPRSRAGRQRRRRPSIAALKPMTGDVKPITADERAARIEQARKLMVDNKIDAIYLEGGSSMFYFTGVRWGLSERPFVCVIPAKGELGWVCPASKKSGRANWSPPRTPTCACGRKTKARTARSPRSSRTAASARAASASKSACASSSTAA